jgi:hypothetical protein
MMNNDHMSALRVIAFRASHKGVIWILPELISSKWVELASQGLADSNILSTKKS